MPSPLTDSELDSLLAETRSAGARDDLPADLARRIQADALRIHARRGRQAGAAPWLRGIRAVLAPSLLAAALGTCAAVVISLAALMGAPDDLAAAGLGAVADALEADARARDAALVDLWLSGLPDAAVLDAGAL